MRNALLVLALSTVTASSVAAQAAGFDWRGRLEAGQTLEIQGVGGDIRALASDDATAHVTADRFGRRSDPTSVRIEVVEHAGGITICAVYPTPPNAREENECRPGGGRNSTSRNDVQVDFTVRVPAGVRFAGHTVNGDVDADGIGADVKAGTVNGNVDIRTTGFAEARTVNGNISCRLGRSSFENAVEFETVNGSITIEMPEGLNADFSASTVNGSIDSDFPILVTGKVSRRSLRGAIGSGGPELRLSTVNGSIRLRKI
jgi:opacity protein-like surface antigen